MRLTILLSLSFSFILSHYSYPYSFFPTSMSPFRFCHSLLPSFLPFEFNYLSFSFSISLPSLLPYLILFFPSLCSLPLIPLILPRQLSISLSLSLFFCPSLFPFLFLPDFPIPPPLSLPYLLSFFFFLFILNCPIFLSLSLSSQLSFLPIFLFFSSLPS